MENTVKVKKVTKRENYTRLLNIAEVKKDPVLVDFIKGEIALLDKKALKNKTSATKTANEEIKTLIVKELITLAEPHTVSEILTKSQIINTAVGGSNQKLTALLTQLVTSQKVKNIKDKKRSLYFIDK